MPMPAQRESRVGSRILDRANCTHFSFYYWSLDSSTGNPYWHICWDNPEDPECKPGAQPQQWTSTSEEDQ